MSGALAFFLGSALALDTQTVTVGAAGTAGSLDRQRGYNSNASIGNGYVIGSIADGTSNVYGGAAIVSLCWSEGFGYQLVIAGLQANSGWASILIAGARTLTRASAAFSQSGGNSIWTWNQDTVGTQAFGGSGNVGVAFN